MENNKRCPFLKIQACGYCSLFSVRKMIPIDQMKTESLCLSQEYQHCEQYIDMEKKSLSKPAASMNEDVKGFIIRKNYFYNYGHTWVKKENENEVRIGIDDFASKLLGSIKRVELISGTNALNSGKVFMKVWCGEKNAYLISPVDGMVLEVNKLVKEDAGIVKREPYDNGWLLLAKTKNEGLKWLFSGTIAKEWVKIETERLHNIIGQDVGTTVTDGGVMIERLTSLMQEEEWNAFIRAFMLNG